MQEGIPPLLCVVLPLSLSPCAYSLIAVAKLHHPLGASVQVINFQMSSKPQQPDTAAAAGQAAAGAEKTTIPSSSSSSSSNGESDLPEDCIGCRVTGFVFGVGGSAYIASRLWEHPPPRGGHRAVLIVSSAALACMGLLRAGGM